MVFHGQFFPLGDIRSERAWFDSEGRNAAEGIVSVIEVYISLWYFWIVQAKKQNRSSGVYGSTAGKACVLGLITGTVTFSKTSLYFKFSRHAFRFTKSSLNGRAAMKECFLEFKHFCHANWWVSFLILVPKR